MIGADLRWEVRVIRYSQPRRAAPSRPVRPVHAAVALVSLALVAGCASFPPATEMTAPPSLTPVIATVIPPFDATGDTPSGQPPTTTPTDGETDPCGPPELPVVAVCLDHPWGLAPLPDGTSALVGERRSGTILRVGVELEPTSFATVDDLAPDGDGGLLGLALSAYYPEDGLVFAFVTTADGGAVLRLTDGGTPTPVLTDLPADPDNPGGALLTGTDGMLYLATGAGSGDRAGSVLRFDTFGDASPENSSGSTVMATGLTHPTGICLLPDGDVAVIDRRGSSELLLRIRDGEDYTRPTAAQTVWTFRAGAGGAVDCTIGGTSLLTTSRTDSGVVGIEMADDGSFTGEPTEVLDDEFGFLRTITTGPAGMVWMTTANRAAAERGEGDPDAEPDPADDRVLLVPPPDGGGGGGDDDGPGGGAD